MAVDIKTSSGQLIPPPTATNPISTTTIHLEVLLKSETTQRYSRIRALVSSFIQDNFAALRLNMVICPSSYDDCGSLAQKVERISVVEIQGPRPTSDIIPVTKACKFDVHVYELREQVESFAPDLELSPVTIDDEGTIAATVSELPCRNIDGLWESLVFDEDIKHRLLHFMSTIMLFSDRQVNHKIVSWNRIILLHGPPGTGKTSLCKAIAQKLTIRLSKTFTDGKLVEISAHSLFSKWFSESGKLVGKLFAHIREMMKDDQTLICVLIDEVESLASARQAAAGSTEPSDALRVVNALLTELDKLRSAKNVLILTTSNLIDAMDPAFIDRVDVKQYVGLPSTAAIYEILRSCVLELVRCGLVRLDHDMSSLNGSTEFEIGVGDDDMDTMYNSSRSSSRTSSSAPSLVDLDCDVSQSVHNSGPRVRRARRMKSHVEELLLGSSLSNEEKIEALIPAYSQASLNIYSKPTTYSSHLIRIAQDCKDLGGRTLRRLVVLAHAKYIHRPLCTVGDLLDALARATEEEQVAQMGVVSSGTQRRNESS
ncbi:P-loop containing nucleoside triphosphate hydrolase protein [Lipomyces tetrasporus]